MNDKTGFLPLNEFSELNGCGGCNSTNLKNLSTLAAERYLLVLMLVFLAELHARRRSPIAGKIYRKFGNHVTVHRTTDRPSVHTTGIPMKIAHSTDMATQK